MVVDDDPDSQRLLARQLTSHGYQVLTASDGDEALEIDLVQAPQMIITDWIMPRMSGLDLCRRLRAQQAAGFVYIIILTAHSDGPRVVEALNSGADEFLSKPYSREELLARVRAGGRSVRLKADLDTRTIETVRRNVTLATYNEKLRLIAAVDELTGLANRREAVGRLAEHWALSVRQQTALSCVMADIDHFTHFKNTYGHAAGDFVLVQTVNRLRTNVRSGERLYRFGGEEFSIICPGSPATAARQLAERLCHAVRSSPVKSEEFECDVTINLGVDDVPYA